MRKRKHKADYGQFACFPYTVARVPNEARRDEPNEERSSSGSNQISPDRRCALTRAKSNVGPSSVVGNLTPSASTSTSTSTSTGTSTNRSTSRSASSRRDRIISRASFRRQERSCTTSRPRTLGTRLLTLDGRTPSTSRRSIILSQLIACLLVLGYSLFIKEEILASSLEFSNASRQLSSELARGPIVGPTITVENAPFEHRDNRHDQTISDGSVRSARAAGSSNEAPRGTTLVHTKHGIFRGLLIAGNQLGSDRRKSRPGDSRNIVGFLGIRYASAPVKRLRFMPPTAYHYAPNQLHDAQRFGPICMQRWPVDLSNLNLPNQYDIADLDPNNTGSDRSMKNVSDSSGQLLDIKLRLLSKMMPQASFSYVRPLFRRLIAREQSEDCLNLNIYAPLEVLQEQGMSNATTLPVLVIIHGESFDYGAGSAYDGHKLIRDQQMLVITFNYRLNILGFPPKLHGASRGNLGLMDQVAALHWIRDNIGSFGGSAGNITLMGTKRGAIFVNLLMLSPMAKGLFQRAIMEDGSALSPITANHVMPQYQHSSSAQYLRVLAKLCDCPMPPRTSVGPTGGGGGSGASNQSHVAEDGGAGGSSKTNGQLIDCLRYKPVEQVVQRVPLEVLQLDSSTGELSINPKWINKIRGLVLGGDPAALQLARDRSSLKPDQFIQLVRQITDQEVKHSAPASDLFEAIYAQGSSSNVRPLFGPVVDGSIVPDEDLASSMLRDDSTFAQRDLLIGLAHPALASGAGAEQAAAVGFQNQSDHLGIDNHLSERIYASTERLGLTNEQAISLVNAFVRSFYRFHNQEIANSILNHYLSLSNKWQQAKQQQQQHKPPVEQPSSYHSEGLSSNELAPATTTTTAAEDHELRLNLQRQRQELLLGSVSEMFQDSLTDVPLFKVALIHSMKQLDPLVDVFVGQRFEEWKTHHRQQQPFAEPESFNSLDSERKSMLDSFTAFARTLYEQIDWPLELKSPQPPKQQAIAATAIAGATSSTREQLSQPKSTYLYEFDGSTINRSIRESIERIIAKEEAARPGAEQENTWKLVRAYLLNLDIRLKSEKFQQPNFGCGYYPARSSAVEFDAVARLEDWLCQRRTKALASFVATGNVNSGGQMSYSSGSDERVPLAESLAELENRCSRQEADHHSVQPSMSSSTKKYTANNGELSQDCRQQLSDIATTLLIAEFEAPGGGMAQAAGARWETFNIFSQQVATWTDNPATRWTMNHVSDDSNERSSLASKASFWFNFIPALNCNKTQPIIPAALLDGSLVGSSANHSSLLNLNLQFSCQHGARTAQDLIESIVSIVRQRLQARKAAWRSYLSNSQPSSQNHHTLRMANMSQSGPMDESSDSPADESTNQQQQQQSNISSQLSINGSESNGNLQRMTDAWSKITGAVLVLCALVVGVTLIFGAYVGIRQRRREKRLANGKQAGQQQQNNVPPHLNSIGNHLSHQAMEIVPGTTLLGDPTEAGDQSRAMMMMMLNESLERDNHLNQIDTLQAGDNNNNHTNSQQEASVASNENQAFIDQASNGDAANDYQVQELFTSGGGGGGGGGSSAQLVNNPRTIYNCRSQSAASLARMQALDDTKTTSFGDQIDSTGVSSIVYATMQEPIILPILSNNHHHHSHHHQQARSNTLNLRKGSYLADVEHRSSSETQNGHSSSSTLTAKKRVKINDPQSIMKQHNSPNEHLHHHYQHDPAVSLATAYQQQRDLSVQLCPIHSRSSSHQQLAGAPLVDAAAAGYYLTGSEFLTLNTPETWTNEGSMNVSANNRHSCDHFSSSTTTASQEIELASNQSLLAAHQQQQQQHSQYVRSELAGQQHPAMAHRSSAQGAQAAAGRHYQARHFMADDNHHHQHRQQQQQQQSFHQ